MKYISHFYKWYSNNGINQDLRRSAGRKFRRSELGQKMTVRTVHDFLIAIKVGDPVDTQIALHSEFEPVISALIKKLASACSNFIDIGCNIGYFTCLFRQYNKSAPIVAIDANPDMIARCRENISINKFKDIQPINIGVTQTKGVLPFYVAASTPSLASFGTSENTEAKIKSGAITVMEVETKPLPDILSDLNINTCGLIKIDIEGYEPSLFAGLNHDFHLRAERIIFEYVPSHIKTCNLEISSIWQAPCMKFYRIYGLHTNNINNYIEISDPDNIPREINTIFCIRKDLPNPLATA